MATVVTQQSGPYIPPTDAAFRDWLANFSTLISADPPRYGLDASDATVIANHNTAYNAAYLACTTATTRTTGAVTNKDAVKASAIASIRIYAQIVKANVGVTAQDKIDLGLHLNDPTPTPIPVPVTRPMLMIQAAFSGEHLLRYADELTPASRKKPYGAVQIQINRKIDVGATTDPEDSSLVGLFTKQPVTIAQNAIDASKTATYFARWVTRKGEFGPWSLPVAMTIAFGGPVEVILPTGGTPEVGGGEGFQGKIAA